MPVHSRGAFLGVLVHAATSVACAAYHPPFTAASRAGVPADPRMATVVFLWPATSCDPAGYFTLATSTGRFVGNVSPGKQLRAELPAGEYLLVGWNDVMEGASGTVSVATVPVLHATIMEGRTYFVRMAFGEWDETGPRQRVTFQRGSINSANRCLALGPAESTTSAMVAVTPASGSWAELPGWTEELEVTVADRAAGQAWLDATPEVLGVHRAVAEARYAGLRPRARQMATVGEGDGVVER
jgi:hypothetical protein